MLLIINNYYYDYY